MITRDMQHAAIAKAIAGNFPADDLIRHASAALAANRVIQALSDLDAADQAANPGSAIRITPHWVPDYATIADDDIVGCAVLLVEYHDRDGLRRTYVTSRGDDTTTTALGLCMRGAIRLDKLSSGESR